MRSLTGTGTLLKLALRRDRIKLPAWVFGLALMTAGFATTYKDFFKTKADLLAAIDLYLTNPAARSFGWPADASLGSYAMLRTGMFIGIILALFNIFLIVRHTRQNEETEREELIRSARVGRFASLSAAVLLALGANLVLGALIAVLLVANQYDTVGSWTAGAGWAASGFAFACITAVTAQLARTTRNANALGGVALGIAYVLSAAGGMLGTVHNATHSVTPAWPTWFSPLGWFQLLRPFSENNWWWLLPSLGFSLLCLVLAYRLAARRDVGMGMLPERRGPAHAHRSLLSPFGLVWRLQRGAFYGWLAGAALFGLTMGSMCKSIQDALSPTSQLKTAITRLGGTDQLLAAYLAIILSMIGAIMTVFIIQIMLRAHHEEESGTGEAVLTTRVSRGRWLGAHILLAVIAAVTVMLSMGIATGITAGLSIGNMGKHLGDLIPAALAQIPAMAVLGGLTVALFGWLPRWTTGLSWTAYALAMLTGPIFATLFNLSQPIKDLSPFTHIPNAPASAITAEPLVVLSGIAVTLAVLGLIGYRRRNIASEA